MASDPEPFGQELTVALELLIDVFAQRGVSAALIGGIAAGLRGRLRYTEDIDFLVSMPKLTMPGVLEELLERGFQLDLLPTLREWDQHHMIKLQYGEVQIDWLKPVIPAYQHILDRATKETWHGREFRLATAEGLIVTKLIAARDQDWLDIGTLLAANRGHLELPWIEGEWLTLFALDDPRWQRYQQSIAEYYIVSEPEA